MFSKKARVLIKANRVNNRIGGFYSSSSSIKSVAMTVLLLFLGYQQGVSLITQKDLNLSVDLLKSISMLSIWCYFFAFSSAQANLFEFDDFDMLSSLPVTYHDIVTSKMASFVFMVESMTIPLYVGFFVGSYQFLKLSVSYLIYGLVMSVFICLIPSVIGAVITYFIMKVTAGKLHEDMIQNALSSLLFLFLWVQPEKFLVQLNINFLPFGNLFVKGLVENDPLQILAYAILSVGIMWLFLTIFSKRVMRVIQLSHASYHVENFKLEKTERNSVFKTLWKNEIALVNANFYFFFQSIIVGIFALGATIYFILHQETLLHQIGHAGIAMIQDPSAKMGIGLFLFIGISKLILLSDLSFSMEGLKVWILKTLPLTIDQIFYTKLLFHTLFSFVPVVLCWIILAIFSNASMSMLWIGIFLLFYSILTFGFLGLFLDFNHPTYLDPSVKRSTHASLIMLFIYFGVFMASFALLSSFSFKSMVWIVFGVDSFILVMIYSVYQQEKVGLWKNFIIEKDDV